MSAAPVPQPRHRWFAAIYDPISSMSDKKMRAIRTDIVSGASGRVLELGCGTGANFAHYDWSKVDSLEATEPDPFMLARAEAKASTLKDFVRSRVSLRQASAEALPFDDAGFDCIVATLVFCTVSDQKRALAEAFRVLKPSGSMRLVEHVATTGFGETVQHVVQPVYGWMSAGCHLGRHTEKAIEVAGLDLEVTQRMSLGPLFPCFVGVATKAV